MVEAVMIWNEPNNKSHWDFEIDPGWQIFAKMVNHASACTKAVNPALPCVLGGISPIDPAFIQTLAQRDVLNHIDVVAVHGFPLDWNHWTIHEWPDKLNEIRSVTNLPSGCRKWEFLRSELKKSRSGASIAPPSFCAVRWTALIGIVCTICRGPGLLLRGTAKRKAPPIIAISTWV